MTIENIKKKMLEYRDFYGGDISDTQSIENATTKKELRIILEIHKSFMEDMLSDAFTHIDNFKKELGLHQI